MEIGIVCALGYWGYQSAGAPWSRILLAVAAPVLGFGFWGAVDFRQAGRWAEPLRLTQELVVSGLAAVALYASGQHLLAWVLAAVSVVHHVLIYVSGGRLLKP
jgi:hypothetical protein